jgi:hypothetical protein
MSNFLIVAKIKEPSIKLSLITANFQASLSFSQASFTWPVFIFPLQRA